MSDPRDDFWGRTLLLAPGAKNSSYFRGKFERTAQTFKTHNTTADWRSETRKLQRANGQATAEEERSYARTLYPPVSVARKPREGAGRGGGKDGKRQRASEWRIDSFHATVAHVSFRQRPSRPNWTLISTTKRWKSISNAMPLSCAKGPHWRPSRLLDYRLLVVVKHRTDRQSTSIYTEFYSEKFNRFEFLQCINLHH